MAAKKNVLDYDPLAWLNDEEDTPGSSTRSAKASKKTAVASASKAKNSAAKKKAASKVKTVKKAVSRTSEDEDIGFGFFDSETTSVDSDMTNENSSSDLLSMGSELTIKNIAEFKEQVGVSLANDRDIKLDPSDLQKIDTAGLQLLYSLHKSLGNRGQGLQWASKNPVINSAASILGLNELLNASTQAGESNVGDQTEGYGFF